VATSIDGRIARDAESGTDWTSKEDWRFFQKSLAKMDAVIVGRNTYKIAEKRLRRRNTIVLTSRGKFSQSGSVFFLNPSKHNLRAFLNEKNFKKVAIVGGGQVYDYCLRHKMLDELWVTVEPYVFTGGVPMFAGEGFKKHKFVLVSAKKLNKRGTILLQYRNES
jgi:dihydrofolate reductase